MAYYTIQITEDERKLIEEALIQHGQTQFTQAQVVSVEQRTSTLDRVIEISRFALFVAKLKPLTKTQRATD